MKFTHNDFTVQALGAVIHQLSNDPETKSRPKTSNIVDELERIKKRLENGIKLSKRQKRNMATLVRALNQPALPEESKAEEVVEAVSTPPGQGF